MTSIRRTVALATLALVTGAPLLAGCATGTTPRPPGDRTYQPDDLVFRIRIGDGFVPVGYRLTQLPVISVYGDGRVITLGPTVTIYPGPALPNVQLQHITPAGINTLVDQALDAGVGSGRDLGQPRVADAPSTYFSVLAEDQTAGAVGGGRKLLTTGVNALGTSGGDGGLTGEQRAARAKLTDLVNATHDLKGTLGAEVIDEPGPYPVTALAAIAAPWADPGSPGLPTPPEVAWPGPDLPGTPLTTAGGYGCVTVTDAATAPVLAAATKANTLTPWTSAGKRWTVGFRPLLPDEKGCANLDH